MKNLPTQIENGGEKLNDSEIELEWSKEAQDSIFYYREDANNA